MDSPEINNRTAGDRDADPRQKVIAAAWRVICRDGLTAASLRTIAAEMGATTGLVTRYYPEKHTLMLAALEQAAALLCDNITNGAANSTGIARIEATVHAALPVTPERLSAWRVWLAFIGELPSAQELGVAHAAFPARLRQILVQGLREAQRDGGISSKAYPPQLADMLVNQIIGLGMRGVIDPLRYPAEKLPALIAPLFSRLLD